MPRIRGLLGVLLAATLIALTGAGGAEAAFSKAFVEPGVEPGVDCTVVVGGKRQCSGVATTFDGAPIDVNVGFPPAAGGGPDGNYPVVGVFHGWGGSKLADRRDAAVARRWLRGLQHERPRLGQLLRRHDPKRSAGVRERLQPPDGHPLRGP